MFDRLKRDLHQALDPDRGTPRQRPEPTVETLLPGDVVSFWGAADHVVQAVLECREELNRRESVWRWNLLDEGAMLSGAPEGHTLYRRTAVLHQDSAEFETLTADAEQGGVLKAFEMRVRQGIAARNPTLFEYGGRVYRVVSTGIFDAQPIGHQASYPKLEVWRDINPTSPGDNVYFELEATVEEAGDEESEVLGIWTSHIALLFGRPLKAGDIQSIYPGQEAEGQGR